ncbi:MAG: pirin family protein [Alphaproteobacteria bacterium]|nr:pirin family protein [Alphaproteobacteria bacterium]
MQMEIRRSAQRGHADHGWLDSHHTFSFASYHDPRHMGFGALRVINEDRVAPGAGFGTHGHRNMEIISYPVSGGLGHRDSTGSASVIHHGDVQVMSAGQGVRHSEMNGSQSEPVHFLQIWILPREGGGEARYEEKHFALDQRGLVLLVSGDGRDGSLRIGQDAELWRALLQEGEALTFTPRRGRQWVQVVSGTLEVSGALLQAGDGLAITEAQALSLRAQSEVEALLFDLY